MEHKLLPSGSVKLPLVALQRLGIFLRQIQPSLLDLGCGGRRPEANSCDGEILKDSLSTKFRCSCAIRRVAKMQGNCLFFFIALNKGHLLEMITG